MDRITVLPVAQGRNLKSSLIPSSTSYHQLLEELPLNCLKLCLSPLFPKAMQWFTSLWFPTWFTAITPPGSPTSAFSFRPSDCGHSELPKMQICPHLPSRYNPVSITSDVYSQVFSASNVTWPLVRRLKCFQPQSRSYGNSVTPFLFILESWLGPGSNLTLIYLFLVWSEHFHLIVEYMNLEVCFLLLAFYFMYVFFWN